MLSIASLRWCSKRKPTKRPPQVPQGKSPGNSKMTTVHPNMPASCDAAMFPVPVSHKYRLLGRSSTTWSQNRCKRRQSLKPGLTCSGTGALQVPATYAAPLSAPNTCLTSGASRVQPHEFRIKMPQRFKMFSHTTKAKREYTSIATSK